LGKPHEYKDMKPFRGGAMQPASWRLDNGCAPFLHTVGRNRSRPPCIRLVALMRDDLAL
jgi:hypothetical protein